MTMLSAGDLASRLITGWVTHMAPCSDLRTVTGRTTARMVKQSPVSHSISRIYRQGSIAFIATEIEVRSKGD